MRWEDERYVRIYTRDTADWLALSFDAQALFALLMRKLDRAGLLPLGKHGKRAVAAVIGHVHLWPRLEPALEELLADGCVRIEGDVLVVPNFIAAQEASMSDKQRKAEQRARDRDKAGRPRDVPSRNVTESHAGSREVTPGHTESQEVTPCRTVPYRAEPEAAAAGAREVESTRLGSEAGGLEAPPSTEATVSEPASPRPPPVRLVEPAREDLPVRRSPVLDLTELDEGAAELRAKLELKLEWKFLVAAHERRHEVRGQLETMVEALGVDRAEALCLGACARRHRLGLQPPKALAWFVPLLEEAARGGNPLPPEAPSPEFDQVQGMHDAEVEARWAPLVARMNPAQRETYEREKARLAAEVRSQGLWTTEEKRQLDQAEAFLFEKWSRKCAAGEA